MAKKQELGRDTEGRFRRYIGWKQGNGRLIQHLFRLGRDEEKALEANSRLEQLWACVERIWRRQRAEHKTDDPCPLWDDLTLAIGAAVAKGETILVLQPPHGLEDPYYLGVWLAAIQANYPVIRLQLPDELMEQGRARVQERREEREQQRQREAEGNGFIDKLASSAFGAPGTGPQFHQALAAYADFLKQKYRANSYARMQGNYVDLLKRQFEDCALNQLTGDRIEELLSHFANRPESTVSKGKRLAKDSCRNALGTLRAFLRWLDRSEAFPWQMPRAFYFPRLRIKTLPEDRVKKKKRKHFTTAELQVIWRYALPWDRALILLALNCGFSKAEISTLLPEEIEERNGRKYIARNRGKTEAYGQWVLWPETLEALAYLRKLKRSGPYVVTSKTGKPLDRQTKGGNENGTIRNHWNRLMDRIKEDYPNFHRLPFKGLRKTGSTLIRAIAPRRATELSSMYIAHGTERDRDDALLGTYAARPWRKLHKVIIRMGKMLRPVFQSVPDPWRETSHKVSPKRKDEILELRAQGRTQEEIAKATGLHLSTVSRCCRAAARQQPTATSAQ